MRPYHGGQSFGSAIKEAIEFATLIGRGFLALGSALLAVVGFLVVGMGRNVDRRQPDHDEKGNVSCRGCCGSNEDHHGGGMNGMPRAVAGLLIVNIVVFAAGLLLPSGRDLLVDAGALWYPSNSHFSLWQIVSYMFLHGGIGHIFFNMFALVSFGKILEQQWGPARFLLFYFLCGVGAALIQMGINAYEFHGLFDRLVAAGLTPSAIDDLLANGGGQLPTDPAVQQVLIDLYGIYASPMLGASGAIYGVLVAFGVLFPNAKLSLMFVPAPVAAKYFIPGLLLLDLFSGVTGFSLFGGSIAHFAHLGGALIGFLLMLLWRKSDGGVTTVRYGAG